MYVIKLYHKPKLASLNKRVNDIHGTHLSFICTVCARFFKRIFKAFEMATLPYGNFPMNKVITLYKGVGSYLEAV